MIMKSILAIIFLLFIGEINSQILVGGPCEGCEAIFEYGSKALSEVDTMPGFNSNGSRLKLTGKIYKNDGKTPAGDVILYIYHTNQKGIYEKRGDETGWGGRHGYMRGWIKTDSEGRYTFYTIRPGSYPNSKEPAHIHGIILELNGYYYWIDEWQFKDDPLLEINKEREDKARGGSGITELKKEGNILVAERDIILGKNIPGYK
jgi:protocatechuate 3,4-dioxygenase beta subunit